MNDIDDKTQRSEHVSPGAWSFGDVLIVACSIALLAGFAFPPEPGEAPLPDFGAMDPQQRKQSFFGYLSPIVDRVNQRARAERERLQQLGEIVDQGGRLSWFDRRWLRRAAERLEVALDAQAPTPDALATLVQRAGTVPESLALVQAAKESGWGTSRFAVEGNNLFGQRCYSDDCGLAPRGRRNARFQVAAFESIEKSIEGYVLNLNTHPRYAEFRRMRQRIREAGQPLTGLSLVDGLEAYSERGEEYVTEIRSLIRQNGLE